MRSVDQLVVRHSGALGACFGLMFVGSGTLALGCGVFGFAGGEPPTPAARLAAVVIGAAHLAAGVWLVRMSPSTEAVFDRGAGRFTVRVWGLRRNTEETHRLADVGDVTVEEVRDSEGYPVATVRLHLRDGRRIALHAAPLQGTREAYGCAAALHDFLRLPSE